MTTGADTSQPRQRNPRGTEERLRDELIDTAVRVLAARGDTERLSIRRWPPKPRSAPRRYTGTSPTAGGWSAPPSNTASTASRPSSPKPSTAPPPHSRHCAAGARRMSRSAPASPTCTGSCSAPGQPGPRPWAPTDAAPPRRHRLHRPHRLDPALPQRRGSNPPPQPVPGLPAMGTTARHDRRARRKAGDALARRRRNDRPLPGLPGTAHSAPARGLTSRSVCDCLGTHAHTLTVEPAGRAFGTGVAVGGHGAHACPLNWANTAGRQLRDRLTREIRR